MVKNSLTTGVILLLITTAACAQETTEKSTHDLDFLLGDWEIKRTYSPGSEEPRMMSGTLSCQLTLDDQFIRCLYDMERPGKIRGLDEVFFNYNGIYDHYESLWLSSTWPVKVLMEINFQSKRPISLTTEAQFPIGNEVMEYVRGELVLQNEGDEISFLRKTFIRTSKDEEGVWKHHMNEAARLVKRD